MGCGASDLKSVSAPEPFVSKENLQGTTSLSPGSKARLGSSSPIPLDAITSNLEARQAMGPSFSDPSFVQKNYKMPAPPLNEAARQDFVEKLHVPRSHPKADEATKLLCDLLEMPLSCIAVLGAERQQILSASGVASSQPYTDRKVSFCAWLLVPEQPELLIVEDMLADSRFAPHPLVTGPPHVRFHAAAPLISSMGYRLGSMSVTDLRPRKMDVEQCTLLCNLAELVARGLESNSSYIQETINNSQAAADQPAQLPASISPTPVSSDAGRHLRDALGSAIMLVDVSYPKWRILFCNGQFDKATGLSGSELSGQHVWDHFTVFGKTEDGASDMQSSSTKLATSTTSHFSTVIASRAAVPRTLFMQLRPACAGTLDEHMPVIAIPSFVRSVSNGACPSTLFFAGLQPLEQHRQQMQAPSVKPDQQGPPIEDLKLGQLIVKTRKGRLFRGTYQRAPAAIKITDTPLTPEMTPASEAVISSSLHHPNILVTLRYACRPHKSLQLTRQLSDGEKPVPVPTKAETLETWIVRAHCDKGSLQDAIERGWFRKNLSLAGEPDMLAIISTAQEVIAALAYMHERDLIHGDVRGANIMLCSSTADQRGFTAQLADFENACQAEKPYNVVTARYSNIVHSAPELLRDYFLTKAADVYAFGILLWEMCTGQKPWVGLKEQEIITKVVQNEKQPLFPRDTPAPFKVVANQCLAADMTLRPSASSLIRILGVLKEAAEKNDPAAWKDVNIGNIV